MPFFLPLWKLPIEGKRHVHTFEILKCPAAYPFQAFIFITSVSNLLRRNESKLQGLSLKRRNRCLLRESNEKHKWIVEGKTADVAFDGA